MRKRKSTLNRRAVCGSFAHDMRVRSTTARPLAPSGAADGILLTENFKALFSSFAFVDR
jgi:hypothetical protein